MSGREAPDALRIALRFAAGDERPVARAAMVRGVAQLEWRPEAIAAGLPVDPLRYPLVGGVLAARTPHFGGLHGFLADSLPDGWGLLLLGRRLARQGRRLEDLSPIDRLAYVGDRGRGALTFGPAAEGGEAAGPLDIDALAEEAAVILEGRDGALADLLARLGGASGGARPKVHLAFDAQGTARATEAEAGDAHESWIVKFKGPEDPLDMGPIEHAYAALAARAGLTVAESRLIPAASGPAYFATRRFDRPAPGARLHMLSLCGALEAPFGVTAASYDLFLRATLAITRSAEDVEAAFRRMVFNVLACNRDDHTRQQSYLMGPRGGWRLAPAYDLTFSTGPGGEHYLDVAGEARRPTRAGVDSLAERHGLGRRAVDEMVERSLAALADWDAIAAERGVGRDSRRRIAEGHTRVRRDFAG